MSTEFDNETWLIEFGDEVIQKKARFGIAELTPVERLTYCLWVADYSIRNGGDLAAANDLYEPFQTEAVHFAGILGLSFTVESFLLPRGSFASEYFKRFERICLEIKHFKQSI